MAIGVQEIKTVIQKLCSIIIQNEVYFCELDSSAGDGDFGMSLAKGFKVVLSQNDQLDDSSIQMFLRECGMTISEFCGGASGPIWSSAFRAAAMSAKDKESLELDDIAQLFEAAVEGIQKRGGAKIGDKTLLDALIPATEALKESAEEKRPLKEAFIAAADRAKTGAEDTKHMVASKGRASYVGERSLQHPDAGAMAISVILNAFTANEI